MDLVARLEIVEAENDMLRAQLSDLRAQLVPAVIFPIEWRLTATEGRLLAALFARDVLRKEAAMMALYHFDGRDAAEPKIVDVFVCKIRKKLKPFGISILTRWGEGWSLDQTSRQRVKAAVAL